MEWAIDNFAVFKHAVCATIMSEWYYRIGERIYGPYSEEDLRERIKYIVRGLDM